MLSLDDSDCSAWPQLCWHNEFVPELLARRSAIFIFSPNSRLCLTIPLVCLTWVCKT